MPYHHPEPQAPVYRDEAPPPGSEVHYGQSTERTFIIRVETVDGEIDGELKAAIIAYVERIDRQRHRRPNLRLLSAS